MYTAWPDLYVKAFSQSDAIADPQAFASALRGLLNASNLRPTEYTTGDHPFLRCAGNWIRRIIPRRERGGGTIRTSEGVEFSFGWTPPEDPMARFDDPARHAFNYIIPPGLGWDRAVEVLKHTVTHFDAFWGELNDGRIVGRPSFCAWDSHTRTVPHIAMMNYWGPEYIGLFGGRPMIERAGFHSVTDHHKGVLVYVGPVSSCDEFEEKQAQIENELEQPDIWSSAPEY